MKSISTLIMVSPKIRQSKSFLPRLSYIDLMALVIITIAGIFLFTKNILVENAVVFHDEYTYKVNADRQLEPGIFIERNLAVPMPNQLFSMVYGLASYFGSNYYIFAQFLNVIWWALGLFVLFRLGIQSGLSEWASIAFLVVIALLPFSAYTKYFMPESMYFFMFCLMTYLLFIGTHMEDYKTLVLSGIVVGLMYFVKPHAIFVFIPSVIYLSLVKLWNGKWLVIAYCVGGITSMVLGKAFLFRSSCPSPYLCAYSGVLDTLLGALKTYNGEFWVFGRAILHVGIGHSIFLFSVFGLAFLTALAVTFPHLHLLEKDSLVPQSLELVCGYILILSVFLLAMATLFTVLINEPARIHTRYYFFTFPLLVLVIFHFPKLRLSRAGIVTGLAIGLISILSLISRGRNYSDILPISLVSDAPELGYVFISKPILYLSATFLILTTVWVVIHPSQYGWLVGVIVLISLFSSANVFNKQHGIFRGLYTTGQEAIAVEQIIGREQMDRTIIIGENLDIISKFLFFLSSAPNIDYLDRGNSVESSLAKFPDSEWVVAISDGYLFPDRLNCSHVGKTITLCSLAK